MNKVMLIGRLTKDPELKYTSTNNTANCSFTLAVDKRVKQGEDKQADFINCVAWTKTAEFVAKYFSKGSMIAVVGRIATRNYEGKDGKKVYVTEVIVEEVSFCGGKNESGQQRQENPNQYSQGGSMPLDDADDDLPF